MMCSTLHAVFVTLLIRPLHSLSPNGLIRQSSSRTGITLDRTAKNTNHASSYPRYPNGAIMHTGTPPILQVLSPTTRATRLDYSSSGSPDGIKRSRKKRAPTKEPSDDNSPSSNSASIPANTTLKSKSRFHPRNAFQGSYDMERLCSYHPELTPFLRPGHAQKQPQKQQSSVSVSSATRTTIDFSDPLAVRALNAALLSADYGISKWASFLPATSLIPPIPGRADYIHHVADILASSQSGIAAAAKEDTTHVTTPNAEKNSHAHRTTIPIKIPTGPSIRGLDIGTGASLIYPLLGTQTYGWSFLATDVDPTSMASARSIYVANHDVLSVNIDIRLQRNKQTILKHVLTADDERIDFCMCNPPFYESAAAYQKENARKVRNLAANARKRQSQSEGDGKEPKNARASSSIGSNNFGGGPSELWYPGGEVAFIAKMMEESSCLAIDMPSKCLWFSSLVSRRDNLPKLIEILESNVVRRNKKVKDVRIIQMGQGGLKTSQILFWSFHDVEEQRAWFRE